MPKHGAGSEDVAESPSILRRLQSPPKSPIRKPQFTFRSEPTMQRILRINIPFVTGRCDYYGRPLFRSVTPDVKHAYLDALLDEARSIASEIDMPFNALCLANGAIGTIEPQKIRVFLRKLKSTLPFSDECHLYAEADPGLLSSALMAELKTEGLAMLRMHYLASDPLESERLERPCSYVEMQKTNIVLESLGPTEIDMQILIGAAGQTAKSLLKTLRDAVLSSNVTHCTIIPASGCLACENSEKAALLSVASKFLESHGFLRYTPLCFAKDKSFIPEESNRYSEETRIGIGPSEISHHGAMDWANCANLKNYIEHASNPNAIVATALENTLDIMMARCAVRALYALKAIDANKPYSTKLISEGLLKLNDNNTASLTEKGCIEFGRVASTVFTCSLD